MKNHSGNQMVDPHLLFEKVQLREGMQVADFGCGRTGHIVFPAAKAVKDLGVVYAVDILKDVLVEIRKRAALSALHNIHTVWSNLEWVGKTAIPAKTLDVVFIVNILDQSENRHGILEEAYRLLKDKGRLIIIDWENKGIKFGPQNDRYLDFSDVKKWAGIHNFAIQEEFEAGPYHKGMVLYKHE